MKLLRLLLIVMSLMIVADAAFAGDDYLDRAVPLDAEAIAEGGFKDAYDAIRPALRKHVAKPALLEERLAPDNSSYAVRAHGKTYEIYGSDTNDAILLWARATHVLFDIVNRQLAGTDVRFYALYGGNDLQGVFLTDKEAAEIRDSIPEREQWPYLPTMDAPWFGQFHEAGKQRPWYQTVPQ